MKLEMNRAWNDAQRLLKASRDVVLVVAGVFFFLPYFAFMVIAPDPLAGAGTKTTDMATLVDRMGKFYAQVWWIILLIVIVEAIGMLGLLALLTDRRRPTVAEALKTGARKVASYVAAYLLLGMGTGLLMTLLVGLAAATGAAWLSGLVVLLIIALWVFLFVRFSLVAPVLVKESVSNPLAALRRSWALSNGNGWRLFAFYCLLIIAYLVVVLVVSMILGVLFGLFGPKSAQFGDALVTGVMNAAWATLFLAVLSAVHDQLVGPSQAHFSETFE